MREIAAEAINVEDLVEGFVESLQRHVEVDDPEPTSQQPACAEKTGAPPSDADTTGAFGGMSEDELLAAIESLGRPSKRTEEGEA